MDFQENKPIYIQIAEGLMDGIIAGNYPQGERIPSVREYAARVEVNANTVMRAYDWLQQQRIIYNKRGIGYFVCEEATKRVMEMRRNIFFRDEASYFFGRLASFGLSPDEVANLYVKYSSTSSISDLTNDQTVKI